MLLSKGFETLLVFVFYLLRGFDLYAHLGIADDSVNLFLVIRMPIGNLVAFVVVAFVGDNLLHHIVLEGVPVIVSTPL